MNSAKDKKIKYFSVLGDSISTLEGYSEPDFASYYAAERKIYSDVFSVADTWWGQVIAHFGGELLANNSFSGSTVCRFAEHFIQSYACSDERTSSLSRDGILPDVIMVFMGINDWGHGAKILPNEGEEDALSVFSVAYNNMLEKLKKNYPTSDIWCLTLPRSSPEQGGERFNGRSFKHKLSEYCNAINACAERYGCRTIDLYTAVGAFQTVDGFHPNANGMKTISDAILDQLKKEGIL